MQKNISRYTIAKYYEKQEQIDTQRKTSDTKLVDILEVLILKCKPKEWQNHVSLFSPAEVQWKQWKSFAMNFHKTCPDDGKS